MSMYSRLSMWRFRECRRRNELSTTMNLFMRRRYAYFILLSLLIQNRDSLLRAIVLATQPIKTQLFKSSTKINLTPSLPPRYLQAGKQILILFLSSTSSTIESRIFSNGCFRVSKELHKWYLYTVWKRYGDILFGIVRTCTMKVQYIGTVFVVVASDDLFLLVASGYIFKVV